MPKYSELDWTTVQEALHRMVTDMEEIDCFPVQNIRVLARGLELVMQGLEEVVSGREGKQ
jgi:hypothetical protein